MNVRTLRSAKSLPKFLPETTLVINIMSFKPAVTIQSISENNEMKCLLVMPACQNTTNTGEASWKRAGKLEPGADCRSCFKILGQPDKGKETTSDGRGHKSMGLHLSP